MVKEAAEKVTLIHAKWKVAQDRQNNYAYVWRMDLKFRVGDRVYFKVSTTKGVAQFKTSNKLKLWYIGPFEIFERVRALAYRLALSTNLSSMHNMFHVSTLKKFVQDQSHINQNVTNLEIQHDVAYVEKLVKILCSEDKVLRRKIILLVEVL